MHPSESIDWKSILHRVEQSDYCGPEPSEPFWFGDSAELSAELVSLVVSGAKTATASLAWEYEYDSEALPVVGQHQALLDWSNTFVGIIRITAVSIVPFSEVSAEYAALEGEGDLSLEFWRDAHWQFFERVCGYIGKVPDKGMPVVCQEFKLEYLFRGA